MFSMFDQQTIAINESTAAPPTSRGCRDLPYGTSSSGSPGGTVFTAVGVRGGVQPVAVRSLGILSSTMVG